MIFWGPWGLKLPDICLTGEEKPRKNLTQKLVPTGDRTGARCVAGAHATAWPTAVDWLIKYAFLSRNYFTSYTSFTLYIVFLITNKQFKDINYESVGYTYSNFSKFISDKIIHVCGSHI